MNDQHPIIEAMNNIADILHANGTNIEATVAADLEAAGFNVWSMCGRKDGAVREVHAGTGQVVDVVAEWSASSSRWYCYDAEEFRDEPDDQDLY